MTSRSAGIGRQSASHPQGQRRNQRMMAGSNLIEPGHDETIRQRNRKAPQLADAARSPRQAAAATTATTATTAATSGAATATSAAPAAAATSAAATGHLLTEPRCAGILLVENEERSQADVGDLLLAESKSRARRGILRRHVRHRTGGCRRCAARQRQRHANDSQRRDNFFPALSLRSLLRHCHRRILHEFQHMFAVARSRRVGFALTPCKAEPLAGTHRRCAGFRLHEPQTACNNRFHEHHMNDIVRFPPESRVVSDSVALTRTEIIDSVPIPKFASLRCTLVCELRNRRTLATY